MQDNNSNISYIVPKIANYINDIEKTVQNPDILKFVNVSAVKLEEFLSLYRRSLIDKEKLVKQVLGFFIEKHIKSIKNCFANYISDDKIKNYDGQIRTLMEKFIQDNDQITVYDLAYKIAQYSLLSKKEVPDNICDRQLTASEKDAFIRIAGEILSLNEADEFCKKILERCQAVEKIIEGSDEDLLNRDYTATPEIHRDTFYIGMYRNIVRSIERESEINLCYVGKEVVRIRELNDEIEKLKIDDNNSHISSKKKEKLDEIVSHLKKILDKSLDQTADAALRLFIDKNREHNKRLSDTGEEKSVTGTEILKTKPRYGESRCEEIVQILSRDLSESFNSTGKIDFSILQSCVENKVKNSLLSYFNLNNNDLYNICGKMCDELKIIWQHRLYTAIVNQILENTDSILIDTIKKLVNSTGIDEEKIKSDIIAASVRFHVYDGYTVLSFPTIENCDLMKKEEQNLPIELKSLIISKVNAYLKTVNEDRTGFIDGSESLRPYLDFYLNDAIALNKTFNKAEEKLYRSLSREEEELGKYFEEINSILSSYVEHWNSLLATSIEFETREEVFKRILNLIVSALRCTYQLVKIDEINNLLENSNINKIEKITGRNMSEDGYLNRDVQQEIYALNTSKDGNSGQSTAKNKRLLFGYSTRSVLRFCTCLIMVIAICYGIALTAIGSTILGLVTISGGAILLVALLSFKIVLRKVENLQNKSRQSSLSKPQCSDSKESEISQKKDLKYDLLQEKAKEEILPYALVKNSNVNCNTTKENNKSVEPYTNKSKEKLSKAREL